jgi:hypothetical protein
MSGPRSPATPGASRGLVEQRLRMDDRTLSSRGNDARIGWSFYARCDAWRFR